jgi:small GTP-binding protein
MSFDYMFKCVLVGNSNVGKSSLMNVFLNNKFDANHEITIGVEFGSKLINAGDQMMKINLWDTAGQECFRSITKSYYRGSCACILVFDVTNENSFDKLDQWIKDIEAMTNDTILVLVGNKNDLGFNRKITYQTASQYAEDHGMHYFEMSAKNQKSDIDHMFKFIAQTLLTKIELGKIDPMNTDQSIIKGSRRFNVDDNMVQLKDQNHRNYKCC